ncbi:MAG: Bax inhibitor-1/YccA family protein, partial [Candidatus Neomarinimicrobiota bacterium]
VRFTAPLYAVLEGLFLGGISALFEKSYSGIVFQNVALTFGTLFCMLIAYKSRLIKPTENFKLGIVAATGGILVFYLVTIILRVFQVNIGYMYASSPLSIGISLFVVVIAALNLVLDFDFIESGAAQGAPKYMEWYGAFGLLVTLVWLYLEILRLLAKLANRR